MLSTYSNQDELLKTLGTISVERFEPTDEELLTQNPYVITLADEFSPSLEMHVYSVDGAYLIGNYDTTYTLENNEPNVPETVRLNLQSSPVTYPAISSQYLSIDTVNELKSLGINSGQYKVVYNLFDNILGSYNGSKLYIKEISSTRREIKLRDSRLTRRSSLNSQIQEFNTRINDEYLKEEFPLFILNFGNNDTYQIINARVDNINSDTPEIVVKLYKPLDSKFGVKSKCWISEEIRSPLLENILLTIIPDPPPGNLISGPNFDLEEMENWSVATDFESWNDLLSENLTNSQQLIDSYFSGSLSGIKLNINYRYFNNFVHFSSAVERVENFKYKLELIEYYNQLSGSVSAVSGSGTSTNLIDIDRKRNAIVSNFDEFEKYLFFKSDSGSLYTHYDETTGSIDPWPKIIPTTTSSYSYFDIQAHTTSSAAITYFESLLDLAEVYDRQNVHALVNTIPFHIKNSSDGDQYMLFVNMIGQHFDILWTYIKGLTDIHTREEHPEDGMPDDLLSYVAKSMGFELLNGQSAQDLWKYALATDISGSALQSEVSSITTLPNQKYTKEIWRRIVNNLPYLLKSKGTSRAIKAMLSCFGIPETILTIREYGGPSTFTDDDYYPEYVHDVFHYTWHASGSTDQYLELFASPSYTLSTGVTGSANVLEFRFAFDPTVAYHSGSYYNILSTNDELYHLVVTKDVESNEDNEGSVILFSTDGYAISASNCEIFDGSWHTIAIENQNGVGSFKLVKTLYGNEIYIKSASLDSSITDGYVDDYVDDYFPESTDSELVIFSSTSGSTFIFNSGSRTIPTGSITDSLTKFPGYYQEIRLWSGSLNDAALIEHAASPNTYTYNVDRINSPSGEEALSPYNNLLQRFTLSTPKIFSSSLSGSFYQNSVHPNQQINTGSIYFGGVVSASLIDFNGIDETYYTPSPSLGMNGLYTNKVRIDSSSINPNHRLNTKTRVSKSSLDKYSRDSNRLGVFFSPQTAINEDIFNQLGYFEIDDYIGDPADEFNQNYRSFTNFGINYWKKYDNRNDFESYFRALEIYDFTLFRYIKRLLPVRCNSIVGLLVEPNVLERSKARLYKQISVEDLVHTCSIDIPDTEMVVSALYNSNTATIAMVTDTSILADYFYQEAEIDYVLDVDRMEDSVLTNRYVGRYRLTESASFHTIQTIVDHAPTSNYLSEREYFYSSAASASLGLYSSSSLVLAEINVDHASTGLQNLRFNGCKLTGTGINIDSSTTTDGGPVVKVMDVNPNQIIYNSGQLTTIDAMSSGTSQKTI